MVGWLGEKIMVQSRGKINFAPISIAMGSDLMIFCTVSVGNPLHLVDREMIETEQQKHGVKTRLQRLNRLRCLAAPKTDEKYGPGVQQI